MSAYIIEAGTGQHIGDRPEQQDRTALFAAPRAPGYMMAVLADGMGGLSGGAMAAEQVIRTAQQVFERFSPIDDIEAMLHTIGEEADTLIKLNSLSSEKQPHSTMVILVLTPERQAIWAHVGDSRLYRFSGPNFAERTSDHTYRQQLLQDGLSLEAESLDAALGGKLVNVLGSQSRAPQVSIARYEGIAAGDAFLLCSDGLWRYFKDAELAAVVAAKAPRQAAEMLVEKARERAAGSVADNCTFAIVKLVKPPKETRNYTVEKMRRAV